MARYGALGEYRFSDTEDAATDIRGSKIYGMNDEKLGEIDDVIFDEATGAIVYVVVDTGGWLSSKKFIVPPDAIRPSSQHEDDYVVDLNQAQIESFPPYDGAALTSEERWADYENRYRSNWVDGPVMHREATDRNITPTTSQLTQKTGATGPKNWQTEADTGVPRESPIREGETSPEASARIIPPTADGVEIQTSATGIGSRWLNFEERLRQRRKEVVSATLDSELKRSETPSGRERKAS